MANLMQLSAEYLELDYLIGTCQSMLHSNDFAIPAQRGVLGALLSAASAGQNAINSLSVGQLETMTAATLQNYLISSRLNVQLNPITHGQVLVYTSWYTDAAFDAWGDHSATLAITPNVETKVVTVHHHKVESDADLYVDVRQDGQSYTLYTRWAWRNGDNFTSNVVDIGGVSINTTIASATWTGAIWNHINTNLISYP